MLNQFSRTQLLFGPEAMERLWKSRVAVFGIGGVGGYAVEALVRSGIGTLDLIDDDRVCLTNLNRQLHATRKTVGKYKVNVAEERVHEINPDCRVNTYKTFYMPDTRDQFDFTQYDYMIDAIDTVTGKLSLIEAAKAAIKDAGIEQDTDLFIVSDHGQLNITRSVALNALLADKGLLTVNAEGQVTDYMAIAKSAGMSAQIYVKDQKDLGRVRAVLEQMREDGLYGFERVFTAEEARREEGLYGDFSFVVETDGYTSFSNAFTRPFVRRVDNESALF